MLFTYEILKTQLNARSWDLFCDAAKFKTDVMKQMYERTMKGELANNATESKYMVKVCTRALTYYSLNKQDSIRKNILDAIQELVDYTGKELGFIDAKGIPWMMIPYNRDSLSGMELHNLDLPDDSLDFLYGDIFHNNDGNITLHNLKKDTVEIIDKDNFEDAVRRTFELDEQHPQFHYFCAVIRNYLFIHNKWI